MTVQEAFEKIKNSEELKKAGIEAVKTGKIDEFLKKNGIDLTIDQIKEYLQNKKGELSKEELNMAAGGCDSDTCGVTDGLFSIFSIVIGCMVSTWGEGRDEGHHIYECF